MLKGTLAPKTFWPQTGLGFTEQLAQYATMSEQGRLFARGPLESRWASGVEDAKSQSRWAASAGGDPGR